MLTVSLDTVSGIPQAAYTGSPSTGIGYSRSRSLRRPEYT